MMDLEEALHIAIRDGFDTCDAGGTSERNILGMERPEYNALCQTGVLSGEALDKETNLDNFLFREGVNLVFFDDDPSEPTLPVYLWDDHRDDIPLMPFLETVRLAEYRSRPGPELRLLSPVSLPDLLMPFLDRPFIGELPTAASMLAGNRKMEHSDRVVLERLRGVRSYAGRIYVCDDTWRGITCGMPFCYSEFAWVEKNICMLLMGGGGHLTHAKLFPFRTV
jgi:hypothetical protein